ncbi:MAG: type II/IV secretion system protein, partial [Planctomycetes bacterium]|nr:type II/IV secretion system protein [Planctomycetota bacterium]
VQAREIDLRVSIIPTPFGEAVVLRILDKQAVNLDLLKIGMPPDLHTQFRELITRPHGIVLVTGPTGSGKTTTLYSALNTIVSDKLKILTIEDPIEYYLEGVNQVQINPKIGLTFASGLRSFLRHDPDVILVGEIRDEETADVAINASLTGHLVFSTLHTNDAPSANTRLLDMGVEPFLLASVLEGVLAQRLGRRICENCRTARPIPEELLHRLMPAELELFNDGQCFHGLGCDECSQSGTRGRIGFYEVLEVTPGIRQAISQKRAAQELSALASSAHVPMRTDGLMKAAQGLTTLDEVLRATQDTEEADL